jgi:hypothetical protein
MSRVFAGPLDWIVAALAACVLLATGCPKLAGSRFAATDELEDVEKKILAAWDNHKSATANVRIVVHDFHPRRGFLDYEAKGTAMLLKHEGKTLARMDWKYDQVVFADGTAEPRDRWITMVADGQYVYVLEAHAKPTPAKSVQKRPDWTRDEACPDPRRVLRFIRDAGNATLLPEQIIDGKKVYVISVRWEKKGSLSLYYFLHDDGAVVRTEEFLSDSKSTGVPGRWIRHEYKDIKFDADIDPGLFVFEPPEGIEVIDMTDDRKRPSGEKQP